MYHFLAGMGEGMRLTLQGLSGRPFQLRPTTCAQLARSDPLPDSFATPTLPCHD
jgi:hypothetical protein